MSNYNIEIDLLKLPGAKVRDIQGKTEMRSCICIPIDSRLGTVADSFFTRDPYTGIVKEVMKKGVTLRLTAFEIGSNPDGQSHLIKPAVSREVFATMTEDQKHKMPWIGNIKPWAKPAGDNSSDW